MTGRRTPYLIRLALYTSAKLVNASSGDYGKIVRYMKPPRRYILQFMCRIVDAVLYLAEQEFQVGILNASRITKPMVVVGDDLFKGAL